MAHGPRAGARRSPCGPSRGLPSAPRRGPARTAGLLWVPALGHLGSSPGRGSRREPPVELARLARALQKRLQAPLPQHVGISERFGAPRPQITRHSVAGAPPTRPLRAPLGPLRWPRGASAWPCRAHWGPVGHGLGATQPPKTKDVEAKRRRCRRGAHARRPRAPRGPQRAPSSRRFGAARQKSRRGVKAKVHAPPLKELGFRKNHQNRRFARRCAGP